MLFRPSFETVASQPPQDEDQDGVRRWSTATARAALGATLGAAFEAALRRSALGRASRTALEAAASRAATGRGIPSRGATAGTVVIATGAERTVPLWLARAVVPALAGPEGALALMRARTILRSLRACPEGPVAGGTPRALVIAARRTFSTLATAAGRSRIAVVTAARTILATGSAAAPAGSGRLLFLRLAHEALHHDLAAFARRNGADTLALTLRAGCASLLRIGTAARGLPARGVLVGFTGTPHARLHIEARRTLPGFLLVAAETVAIAGA
jgi:hypothetical protein